MRVFVGGCYWRNVEVGHMKSIQGLMRTPGFAYWPSTGDALIDRARGISATHFLQKTDYDILLSVDSDIMGFTPEDTQKMCELAMTHDIVAGVYVCRSPSQTHPASFYLPDVEVFHGFEHEPVEVKWCATGFLAVHRRVFEALAETLPLLAKSSDHPFYPFYLPMIYEDDDVGEMIELSEDWAFCQRAKEAGFKCYIDPAVRLGHIGTYTYRLEDTAQKQPEPQPLAIKRMGKYWEVYGDPETLSRNGTALVTASR
jgi:hypothetical protein